MRYQVRDVGVPLQHGRVERLQRHEAAFRAHTLDGAVTQAHTVLLATGALDVQPEMAALGEVWSKGRFVTVLCVMV